MIKCTICGGTLQMSAGGEGATCPDCGVFFPVEALRNMAKRLVDPARPDSWGYAGSASVPVGSMGLPAHHIRNENCGLSLAEHRRLPNAIAPRLPARPAKPGLFAPAKARQAYNEALAQWEDAQRRYDAERAAFERGRAERDAYFAKFYEHTAQEYTVAEWMPYFEGILMENFPEYALRKDVGLRKLFNLNYNAPKAAFVLEKDGRPALAIFLSKRKKTQRARGCIVCEWYNLPALCFHTRLSNRRDYVIDRVRRALNP